MNGRKGGYAATGADSRRRRRLCPILATILHNSSSVRSPTVSRRIHYQLQGPGSTAISG
jgi:hypothetical protein